MAWGQYNFGGSGFGADTVDETAQMTDMGGPATNANQSERGGLLGGPSQSLVALWFVTLAVYAAIGWFFKGQRQ